MSAMNVIVAAMVLIAAPVATAQVTIHPVSAPRPADLDGDGAVGVTDFLALLAA